MSFVEKTTEATRVDWNTPEIIKSVVECFNLGRPVGLDPCSNPNSIIKALRNMSLEKGDDGLNASWQDYGLVYVNPPYGRAIGPWIDKCAREGAKGGAEIIALVPARVDTRWFQKCWEAQAICFWRGRLKFLGADQSATFPSALVYWGPRKEGFKHLFDGYGRVVFSSSA